jgi:hypothetical protein
MDEGAPSFFLKEGLSVWLRILYYSCIEPYYVLQYCFEDLHCSYLFCRHSQRGTLYIKSGRMWFCYYPLEVIPPVDRGNCSVVVTDWPGVEPRPVCATLCFWIETVVLQNGQVATYGFLPV